MKYRFALLALMAVSAAPLAAQGGGGGGGGGGAMGAAGGRQGGGRGPSLQTGTYDQLNEWFAFSAEQKPKVEAAIKDRDAVVTPIMTYQQGLNAAAAAGGGRSPLPADSMTKMTGARTKFQEALKSILAGPQVVKFDSISAAAAARGQGRGGRGGGGGGGGN